MLLWWHVTFMTDFVIDVNITILFDIWQKNSGHNKLVWMASWVFTLFEAMGDMSEYLVYVANVKWRNDKFGKSYVSFGNICSEIEFAEASFGKLVISLRRVIILRRKVEDM